MKQAERRAGRGGQFSPGSTIKYLIELTWELIMVIDKEEFKQHILNGKTIKELQSIYSCGRTTITELKKTFGFVGLSPNSKKIDRESGYKFCTGCNQSLPLTEFYSNGKTQLGKIKYKPQCSKCENSNRRSSYYGLILEYLAINNKNYCCENCGVTGSIGFLDFHHIDSSTKEFNIGDHGHTTMSIDKFISDVVPELVKCKLLCPNCHRIEHLIMGPN